MFTSGLGGCRRDPLPPSASAITPSSSAVASAVAEVMPAQAPGPITPLDQEVSSCLFRVRVEGDGFSKDFPGVLLNHDAVLKGGEHSRCRFVLAHMPGFDEGKLRQKFCKIQVMRRKVDDNDNPYSSTLRAWLLRFHQADGLALLGCAEIFDYEDDAGLTPGTIAYAGSVVVARTFFRQAGDVTAPLGRKSGSVLSHEGFTTACDDRTHEVRLSGWTEREGGEVGAVVLAANKLLGFLPASDGSTATLAPIGEFDTTAVLPTMAVQSMELRYQAPYFTIRYDLAQLPASALSMVGTEVSAADVYEKCKVADEHGQFRFLGDVGLVTEEMLFSYSVPLEVEAGQTVLGAYWRGDDKAGERAIVLQPCIREQGLPRCVGRPLLVKYRKEADQVFRTILSVDGMDSSVQPAK